MKEVKLKIKEIEEELQKLKDYLNKNKEEDNNYKRKKDGRYYFLNDIGAIINTNDIDNNDDNFRYSIGNYFENKKQAENYKERLLIEQELKDIAMELNKGEEIDWNNKEQDKYLLYFDYLYNKNKIDYTQNCYSKIQGTIYCLDKNFKDAVIERIGEERLIKYLKGELD